MKTELEKCLAAEVFNGSDPALVAMTLNAKRLIRKLNDTDYADTSARKEIFKNLFGAIGENVHIDIDFHCEYGKHIFIGERVIINMNCTFIDNKHIVIGNDVFIASCVHIITATHSTNFSHRTVKQWGSSEGICHTYARPVRICDGAWLGGSVTVLPGVTIGRNAVIGAGSVVSRDIPEDCVAVGNPCRVIKKIDNR